MFHRAPRSAAVGVVLLVCGCGAPEATDAGALDGGALLDAPADASAVEVGSPDAREALDAPPDAPRDVDAGPCRLDPTTRSGSATPYVTTATACYPSIARGATAGAAVGPEDSLDPLVGCGTCARVTGPAGTTIVVLDDVCVTCSPGSLDLSEEAFAAVTGATAGSFPMTWELAPCEASGNVRFQLEGSNPFFVLVRFFDHRTPLDSVTLRTSDGTTHSMMRRPDDAFVLTGVGELRAPLTFVVTDAFGHSIDAPLASIDSGTIHDAAGQFPLSCVP